MKFVFYGNETVILAKAYASTRFLHRLKIKEYPIYDRDKDVQHQKTTRMFSAILLRQPSFREIAKMMVRSTF